MIDPFLKMCGTYPDAVALEFADIRVTYAQVARCGAQIAAALVEPGTRDAGLTAVLAERSLSAYGGFIATQLAGHTFVPLNPAFPARALARMQQISGARTIVAGQEALGVLAELLDLGVDVTGVILPECVDIPAALNAFRERGGTVITRGELGGHEIAQAIPSFADRPAYLMFTSGSSGAPKAVAVSRRAATAWLDSMQARFDVGPGDRASHITTLDFDCALLELLLPLSSGACVCVPDQRERFNLGSYIADRRLTVWVSSPSTAILMRRLGVLAANAYPDLRISIFGSEGLPVELALTWLRAAPHCAVHNVYGPTELTVCCSAFQIDPATVAGLAENGIVPIGEPLPGMRVLVVDPDLRAVAPGETGELLMSGCQVADGYWGDPDQSRHAFVIPPGETAVFYRTRDRVRRPLPGKPMTFLGRIDDQLKLNGIRVEPGEIEASLRRATGCTAAVAVGWPAGQSSPSGIVAFVEAHNVDQAAVMDQLRAELPRHMMPRRVIAMSALPRTVRGKLDRRACESLAVEHCGMVRTSAP